jgi:predicted ATPase/predicted negative regulator of RcsB-dependent stress response
VPPPELQQRTTSALPAGAFVGRARERQALDRLIGEGARLVTLVGVAGVGKTRLALEWARGAEGALGREGAAIAFCDLAEARSVDDACAALARVLGVALAASATAEEAVVQLGRALARRERSVLVLDNLEQLAARAGAMIEPWLALAPGAQIVGTSRERLRLRDERCIEIEPLGMPEGEAAPAAIRASEAVELFVARTRQARFDFELGDADAPVVGEIVRRLEGIPLAIELCAARASLLGPGQILRRLARRFELLVTGARGTPARHSTLRAAILWSWELLEPWEKEALAQCAVFRGGFSLEAAEAVLALGDGAAPVLDVLQSLHDKSLLRAEEAADFPGERRFRLLESIRELAEEELRGRGGWAGAVARHAAFFAGVTGAPLAPCKDVRKVALEGDNLAAVCERALAEQPVSPARADVALRALLLLDPLYLASAKGRLGPYAASLDAALAAASPPADAAVVARALYTRALADFLRGRLLDCFLGFQRSLDVARAAGARLAEGLALTKLALMLAHADRPDESAARFEEAEAVAAALGDPGLDGDLLLTRGGALTWLGRAEEAASYHARAIEKLRQAGDARAESMAAGQLALARLNQGRLDEAEAAVGLSLSLLEEQEEQRTEGYVLGILGRIHQARGRLQEARATLAAALDIHRAVGDAWSCGVHLGYAGNVALEEGRQGEARARYGEAVALLRAAAERHYTAIYLAALGAIEAVAGDVGAARARFEEASAALAGVGVLATQVDVRLFRAFLDVAEARKAAAAGDRAAAERSRSAAAEALALAEAPSPGGAPPAAQSSADVRFAMRMLARELASLAEESDNPGREHASLGREHAADTAAGREDQGVAEHASRAAETAEPGNEAALLVGPDARWFRAGQREPVSLLKSRAVRLVLLALVRRRLEAPGAALPLDALFEAGWPGERVLRKAAANRVYVTLTKIKNLGLRGLIQSRDDGFLLDPGALVRWAEPAGGQS